MTTTRAPSFNKSVAPALGSCLNLYTLSSEKEDTCKLVPWQEREMPRTISAGDRACLGCAYHAL
jgi:PIN domain nuclease of toxin-antitoxin system